MIMPFRTATTPLEVLRRAEANLADERIPYEYTDWTRCGCGHLYAAARGTKPRRRGLGLTGVPTLTASLRVYRHTLRLILIAHGHEHALNSPVTAVSRMISSYRRGDSYRTATLKIVQATIRYELDRQTNARTDILRALGELNDGPVLPRAAARKQMRHNRTERATTRA